MYVTLLSGALDVWDPDLDYETLLDHVRDCRAALPSQGPIGTTYSATDLVAEIAYDRALVCLATQHGIDVTPKDFAHPRLERSRLELALARRGVDLTEATLTHRNHPEDAQP